MKEAKKHATPSVLNIPCNRFGIEIEGTLPATVANSWGHYSYHRGTHPECLPEGWEAQGDGSINTQNNRSRRAVEIVSPVLCGEAGIKQLMEVLTILKGLGFETNSSCGVHISVSYDGDQEALVSAMRYLQNGIYAITGTKAREDGDWCKRISVITSLGRELSFTGRSRLASRAHLEKIKEDRDRYRIVNLTHLFRGSNRVEFRAFSNNTDPLILASWVQVCLGICSKVSQCKAITPGDGKRNYKQPISGKTEFIRLMRWLGWASGQSWANGKHWGYCSNAFTMSDMVKALRKQALAYDAE